MNEQGQTLIKNPGNGAERTFTFDHSYWSHEPGTLALLLKSKYFLGLERLINIYDYSSNWYHLSLFLYCCGNH